MYLCISGSPFMNFHNTSNDSLQLDALKNASCLWQLQNFCYITLFSKLL